MGNYLTGLTYADTKITCLYIYSKQTQIRRGAILIIFCCIFVKFSFIIEICTKMLRRCQMMISGLKMTIHTIYLTSKRAVVK